MHHVVQTVRGGLIALGTLALAGCGETLVGTPRTPPFAFSPTSVSARVGTIASIAASGTDADWHGATVQWVSNDERIARLDTTVAFGQPALVQGIAPGATTLRARFIGRFGVHDHTVPVVVSE